jgi:Fe-S-cluster containining protein
MFFNRKPETENVTMEGSEKIPAISSQAMNPPQWLAAYLRRRADLASYKSDFRCDPACTRPGCKNQDLQIPVSIIDLLGAALHRDQPVSAVFPGTYTLGLLSNERQDWIRTVTLRLKKPCPFLENDRCSIYPVRPLPCILFPEYLVNEGRFETDARQDHFKDYLCFQRPIPLSPERAQVMTQLKALWRRESLISSFFLFNHGCCHLDFSNLIQELSHAAGGQRETDPAGEGEPRRIIPHRVIERFFLRHIAECQPFAGVSEKLHHLDTREGQAEFQHLWENDRLMKKLRQCGDDRAWVFRFVQGKLQAQRRSLSPPEYKYY